MTVLARKAWRAFAEIVPGREPKFRRPGCSNVAAPAMKVLDRYRKSSCPPRRKPHDLSSPLAKSVSWRSRTASSCRRSPAASPPHPAGALVRSRARHAGVVPQGDRLGGVGHLAHGRRDRGARREARRARRGARGEAVRPSLFAHTPSARRRRRALLGYMGSDSEMGGGQWASILARDRAGAPLHTMPCASEIGQKFLAQAKSDRSSRDTMQASMPHRDSHNAVNDKIKSELFVSL